MTKFDSPTIILHIYLGSLGEQFSQIGAKESFSSNLDLILGLSIPVMMLKKTMTKKHYNEYYDYGCNDHDEYKYLFIMTVVMMMYEDVDNKDFNDNANDAEKYDDGDDGVGKDCDGDDTNDDDDNAEHTDDDDDFYGDECDYNVDDSEKSKVVFVIL